MALIKTDKGYKNTKTGVYHEAKSAGMASLRSSSSTPTTSKTSTPTTSKTSTPVISTTSNSSFDKQLADIKAQAAKIVTAAQKVDPNIKISTANAEMIGMPKVSIPTVREKTPVPTELSKVGTAAVPKTSQDIARETILSQVPEEDRETINKILGIATGYQTEKGRQYEDTAESLMTQQLANIQSTRDRALETTKMKEAAMLPELEAELESIRGEADVLEARRNSAIQAEARRQGVSTFAMEGNINRIERDFNLDKANLAIRELATVGKINAATKLIDTKLDYKYGDLEAETNLLTAQLNAISPFLSREDQKAAETRLQLNEIVKTKIADAREADKQLEEFKLQSYLFAQQNGATPATLSQIMSSTSREDVASVGGAFIQDPITKMNLETQRLQQIKTRQNINAQPNVPTSVINVGRNKMLINSQTGKIIKSYGDTFGAEFTTTETGEKAIVSNDGTVTPVSQIDFSNPEQIDALPVSDITKAVMQGFAKTKDLTPTQKSTVASELQKVGFNPNTYIVNKLDSLVESWSAIPEDSKGYIQGLKFWESKTRPEVATFESQRTLLTREIARLFDVGVLSDQDVQAYKDAMPSRQDGSIDVVLSKTAGIAGAAAGTNPLNAGKRIRLKGGREAVVATDGETLLDPTTGKPLD